VQTGSLLLVQAAAVESAECLAEVEVGVGVEGVGYPSGTRNQFLFLLEIFLNRYGFVIL
jgi:hypothetical protein